MKNKTKMSIILALMMIVSTFAVGTIKADECFRPLSEGPIGGPLIVEKTVWNGTEWVDEYIAEIDEHVTFNITITYTADCGFKATNITVVDTFDISGELAYTMEYTDQYLPSDSGGGEFVWNLTKDYGIELWDPSSQGKPNTVSIYFNVTFTCGCGELNNSVSVYALETCCGQDLYDEDQTKITVECEEPCEPGIEVIKKVKNAEGEWAEYVDGLHLGDIVEFKIDVIYHDCDVGFELLNLEVRDELPCCLVYNDTIDISTTGPFIQAPKIQTIDEEKVVYWNWTFGQAVVLQDNDSLTIQFTTDFTNYCEEEDNNWVYVTAWGCSGPTFQGEDNATVDCRPSKEFDKTVKVGNDWLDEVNTTVDETLRFKLAITYYGMEEFYILKFKDKLPCILEYADNAFAYVKKDGLVLYSMPIEGDLQSDNKTLWFNLTYVENFTLMDGLEISVEFDVIVTGQSDCGCDCEMDTVNKAWLYLFICGIEEPVHDFYDELKIHSEGNCPPYSLGLNGPSEGLVNQALAYTTSVVDPDGDRVSFMIDWGDGTAKVWDGPYDSGEVVSVSHTFTGEGTYKIKIKAKDEHLLESEWTSTIVVKITKEDDEPPENNIEISVPNMFYLKNIAASIKNAGDATVTNIDWTLTISGGLLGKTIESSGTIALLAKDTSTVIESGDVKFIFGMRTIDIVATVGVETFSETFSCLVLGQFILMA